MGADENQRNFRDSAGVALPAATPKKWAKISAVSIFLFARGFGLAGLFLEKKDKKSVTIALPFR